MSDLVLLRELKRYEDEEVDHLLLEPKYQMLYSIGNNGNVFQQDVHHNSKKLTHKFNSKCLILHANTFLQGCNNGTIKIRDAKGNYKDEIVSGKPGRISSILVDGFKLYMGHSSGNIVVIDVNKEQILWELFYDIGEISCLLGYDGRLYIGSSTGNIMAVNFIKTSHFHFGHGNGRVNKMVEHNHLVYICGQNEHIKCWNNKNKCVKTLISINECVLDLISRGDYLYSLDASNNIQIWDKHDICVRTINQPLIKCMNIFNNNLYTGCTDGSIKIYGKYTCRQQYKHLPYSQKNKVNTWLVYSTTSKFKIGDPINLLIQQALLH